METGGENVHRDNSWDFFRMDEKTIQAAEQTSSVIIRTSFSWISQWKCRIPETETILKASRGARPYPQSRETRLIVNSETTKESWIIYSKEKKNSSLMRTLYQKKKKKSFKTERYSFKLKKYIYKHNGGDRHIICGHFIPLPVWLLDFICLLKWKIINDIVIYSNKFIESSQSTNI